MIHLGILGSTRGTNLRAIAAAIQQQRLAATIDIIISNKSSAPILALAHSLGISKVFVDPAVLSREQYDKQVTQLLQHARIDLVVLIGYMRILSADFVKTWEQKIINIHPSLLPAHAGKMDLAVHEAVLNADEHESGCTVHYVTEEVDAGPVIVQLKCPVLSNDTPEILKKRVQELEGEALVQAIKSFKIF